MGNLIVKDNALIEASHKLSEVEQRLVLLAILKAREFCDSVEQLKDRELIIHAEDYMQVFNVSRQTSYEMLKKAVLGLFDEKWGYRFINNKGNIEVAYERFIQSAKYVENEASVKFMFANAIIPMLVELERSFTSYEIAQVAHLQSRYAMRLYESLIRFKDKNVLKITLEELRFRFGLLENEYKRMGDFKKDVLDLAIKQINENTGLKVTYDQHKQGRNIIGFTFKFKSKDKTKIDKSKSLERDPKTIDWVNGQADNESQLLTSKQADFFANKLAEDSGFGSKFGGSGENMQTFTSRISNELQRDITKLAVYMPYLMKAGYNSQKNK